MNATDYLYKETQSRLMQDWTNIKPKKKVSLASQLSDDELFRFGYVPFVICSLVWDYVDTIIDMSILLQRKEVRHVTRAVRQLRDEYYAIRHQVFAPLYEKREAYNAECFNDAVNDISNQLVMHIHTDINSQYPDLEANHVYLLVAVHQADILLQALFIYVERQRKAVQRKITAHVGNVLPIQLKQLAQLIPLYLGDKPASPRFAAIREQYINTFAAQIGRTQILDRNIPNQ